MVTNLNSSSYDDPHEEVGDNTGYCHHQAFNYGDTCIKAQDEKYIMLEARVESDHEVANSSRYTSD